MKAAFQASPLPPPAAGTGAEGGGVFGAGAAAMLGWEECSIKLLHRPSDAAAAQPQPALGSRKRRAIRLPQTTVTVTPAVTATPRGSASHAHRPPPSSTRLERAVVESAAGARKPASGLADRVAWSTARLAPAQPPHPLPRPPAVARKQASGERPEG
jgi:hypothetical protein